MECWNSGILRIKAERIIFNCFNTFQPIIPSFQYSIIPIAERSGAKFDKEPLFLVGLFYGLLDDLSRDFLVMVKLGRKGPPATGHGG